MVSAGGATRGSSENIPQRTSKDAWLGSECLVHLVGGDAAHRGHPVRVPVERAFDAAVSEELLDVGLVRAASKQERGARVAQIVKAQVRQPCTLKERLEVTVGDVLRI